MPTSTSSSWSASADARSTNSSTTTSATPAWPGRWSWSPPRPRRLFLPLVDWTRSSSVGRLLDRRIYGVVPRGGMCVVTGGGKGTLLGMLSRGGEGDVHVIVLVGERGREVDEFIHDNLGDAGLARSVVVFATADRPALERSRAAWVGTAIAEHLRDKRNRVLLLLRSAEHTLNSSH